jgi:hypothetical protein
MLDRATQADRVAKRTLSFEGLIEEHHLDGDNQ